ncbi:MAG: OadG family protein [Bacteroidales bacterium]|nr:OadG family protein [Bacteroidales bacterium]
MDKIRKTLFIAILCVICGYTVGYAQDDPLIPQSFAVDSRTGTYAVIDAPENTIAILKRTDGGFKIVNEVLVDKVIKRHDVQFIYRPMSVAIYEQNIIYLASNRDSCYFRVMDMKGNDIYVSPRFAGNASAFSYDKEYKHLYIAGLNASGYNVFDIDVSNGFSDIKIDTASNEKAAHFNYRVPKKSEEIAKHDGHGIGLTLIAMLTVFFALMFISIVLMGFAKILRNMQKSKAGKSFPTKEQGLQAVKDFKAGGNLSGDSLAAIAAAIHCYNDELHDEEPTILTIVKVERRYSPWSSKLHNMNVYRR